MPAAAAVVWNLSLEEIESHTGRVLEHKRIEVGALGSTKCSFDTSHVLYSKLRPYLNKVVVPSESGVGTSELIPMRPDPRRLERQFLAWYLRSPRFLDFAAANTRGANLPRIAMQALWRHCVPVPPIDDQQRIIERLDAMMGVVDEIRSLRTVNIHIAPALLPALLREAFSELEDNHPKIPLGDLAIDTRYGTSEKCSPSNTGAPVLRIPNIAGRKCNFDELKFLPRDLASDDPLLLEQGDLLVVRTNGSPGLVGRCAVVPELGSRFGYASYLIRFRFDLTRVRAEYVSYYLSSSFGRLQIAERRRTSAGQFNINSASLKSIAMPVPALDVQDAMLDRMRRIDDAVRAIQERVREQEAREGTIVREILRKAFAGEL